MRSIIKTFAAVPLALALAAGPAGACDPEDLKAEYRNLCATPTDAIASLVQASAGKLKADVAQLLAAKAKQAQQMCLDDKYDDAMKLAVRVARALGSAEQETGLPKEQLTAAPGLTQLAQQ